MLLVLPSYEGNLSLDPTAVATVRASNLCRAPKIPTLVNFRSCSKSKSSQLQRNVVVNLVTVGHNSGVKNTRGQSRGFIFNYFLSYERSFCLWSKILSLNNIVSHCIYSKEIHVYKILSKFHDKSQGRDFLQVEKEVLLDERGR